MKIERNYNLEKLNTFGLKAKAKFFVEVESEKDLAELFNLPEFKENEKVFLGGGSNILFSKDFDGMVVLSGLKGIDILEENSETITIHVMGGEVWHDFVNFAVDRGYWGIENLAFIPGTVGAAPIQNIGAYGAELKDTLKNVEVYVIETGEKKILKAEECKFGYRDSIFKNTQKGKYFISAITLKLSKKSKPNISYKILSEYLEKNKIEVRGPKDISEAVTTIRKSKLPDPKVIGNAGSFFKNMFVKEGELESLLKAYPELVYFKEEDGVKISSAWLIEQCGWKGFREGDAGVHEKQALVLVNYRAATGPEIMALADRIAVSVKEKFDLKLVPEVNIV